MNTFQHGVQRELSRLKWELELREREAATYANELRKIKEHLRKYEYDHIRNLLNAYGI